MIAFIDRTQRCVGSDVTLPRKWALAPSARTGLPLDALGLLVYLTSIAAKPTPDAPPIVNYSAADLASELDVTAGRVLGLLRDLADAGYIEIGDHG